MKDWESWNGAAFTPRLEDAIALALTLSGSHANHEIPFKYTKAGDDVPAFCQLLETSTT